MFHQSLMKLIFPIIVAIFQTSVHGATIFDDRTTFNSFLSTASITVEDFNSLTVNSSGYAARSNGAAFNGFTATSLTFSSDVPLTDGSTPVDTGLDGTFLFRDDGGDIIGLPGGGGGNNAGSPADNDDFQIDFDNTTTAAGIDLIENNFGPFDGDGTEGVYFLDSLGNTIAVATLPVSSSLERKFVGLIVDSGDPLIASIRVDEGNMLDDDIGFDNVTFVSTIPLPAAIWLFGSGLLGLIGFAERKAA